VKRIVYILALALTGCLPDGDKPKPTQAEEEGRALTIYATIVNTTQTNWTVLIIPRTNQWPSK